MTPPAPWNAQTPPAAADGEHPPQETHTSQPSAGGRQEAEGEAAETQTWLEYAVKCEYLDRRQGQRLFRECDRAIGKLVKMGNEPERWILRKSRNAR